MKFSTEHMAEYLCGRLSGAIKEEFEAELKGNTAFESEYRAYSEFTSVLQNVGKDSFDLPRSIWPHVQDRIEKSKHHNWFRVLLPAAAISIACLFLVLHMPYIPYLSYDAMKGGGITTNYNDTRVSGTAHVLLTLSDYVAGSFGVLSFLLCGFLSILCTFYRHYRTAVLFLVFALLIFLSRSLVLSFFNDETTVGTLRTEIPNV